MIIVPNEKFSDKMLKDAKAAGSGPFASGVETGTVTVDDTHTVQDDGFDASMDQTRTPRPR